MEVLVELLVEVVGQLLLEVLVDLGFRPLGRLLASARGRVVAGLVLAVPAGFVGGLLWGRHIAEAGRTNEPTSLWISLALAAVFAGLAVLTNGRGHVSRARLAGYAAVNLAVAAGVAVGFEPMPLR